MKKLNLFSDKDKEKDHYCVFKYKKMYLNSVVIWSTFYRFQLFPVYRGYKLIFPIQRAPPRFPKYWKGTPVLGTIFFLRPSLKISVCCAPTRQFQNE